MRYFSQRGRITHQTSFESCFRFIQESLIIVFLHTIAVIALGSFFSHNAKAQQGCGGIKQMLFVFDVSGGMKTNELLAESKKFALRTLQERSLENLLYKVVSYGGNCNDVVVEVDWTRDVTVVGAGIKGLYAHGETPLASSLDLTIDEIKKSAYPEETQVCLMNNAANSCGSVKEILDKRLAEIPCVKFFTLGIELDELSPSLREKANQDLMMIAEFTKGSFAPLSDIRELTGITLKDSGFSIVPVQFTPRKKTQMAVRQTEQKAEEKTTSATAQVSSNAKRESRTDARTDSSKSIASTQVKDSPKHNETTGTANSSTTATLVLATQSPTASERSTTKLSSKQEGAQSTESSINVGNAPPRSQQRLSKKAPKESTKTNTRKSFSSSLDKKTSDTTTQQNSSDAWQWKAVEKVGRENKQSKKNKQIASKGKQEIGSSQKASKGEQNTLDNSNQSLQKNSSKTTGMTGVDTNRVKNNETRAIRTLVQQSSSKEIAKPIWDSIPQHPFVFEFNAKSILLTPESQRQFSELLQYIKQQYEVKPSLQIIVEGHSSNEGSRVENLRLAVNRASEIATQIRKKVGLQDTAVKWNAFGTLRPAFDIQDPVSRTKNRRVEVLIRW